MLDSKPCKLYIHELVASTAMLLKYSLLLKKWLFPNHTHLPATSPFSPAERDMQTTALMSEISDTKTYADNKVSKQIWRLLV